MLQVFRLTSKKRLDLVSTNKKKRAAFIEMRKKLVITGKKPHVGELAELQAKTMIPIEHTDSFKTLTNHHHIIDPKGATNLGNEAQLVAELVRNSKKGNPALNPLIHRLILRFHYFNKIKIKKINLLGSISWECLPFTSKKAKQTGKASKTKEPLMRAGIAIERVGDTEPAKAVGSDDEAYEINLVRSQAVSTKLQQPFAQQKHQPYATSLVNNGFGFGFDLQGGDADNQLTFIVNVQKSGDAARKGLADGNLTSIFIILNKTLNQKT